MRKQPTIKSNYKSKESFSFDRAPSEFKSVTEKSINEIKSYCSHLIANKYKGSYDARALYAMVGTVVGNFDLLTSRLEDDYSNRRSKLKKAQSQGVKEVNRLILEFEKTIADRERALKRYNDNVSDFDGYSVGEDLHYSKDRIKQFKDRLKKIEERNHEA